MDFGEVLGKAWKIIWKNKILWLFGLLASCGQSRGGGGGGGGQGNVNFQYDNPPDNFGDMFPGFQRFVESIPEEAFIFFAIGMILLVLVLVLLAFFVGTFGEVGMIQGTKLADANGETLTFSQVFEAIKPYYGRALGLNLIVFLAGFAIALVLIGIIVVLSIATLGIGLICLIPLLCIFIPIGIAVGVFVKQSMVALVVEDLGIGDAFKRGWEVLRDNIGAMIGMALILIIGSAIVGFIVALPVMLAVLPAMGSVMYGMMQQTEEFVLGGIAVSLLCGVAYLPISLLLQGILTAYVDSSWTLTFLRLTGQKPEDADVVPPEPQELPEPA
ncbi:MAG: hypothetical protein JXB38_12880 [Anaerolineales bacterium]|nr:hypothetical protein [Anaerolineales bacterium]